VPGGVFLFPASQNRKPWGRRALPEENQQHFAPDPTPALIKIFSSGQKPVKAVWNRLNPTNAGNRNQSWSTK
jgi:hypothetical protein